MIKLLSIYRSDDGHGEPALEDMAGTEQKRRHSIIHAHDVKDGYGIL